MSCITVNSLTNHWNLLADEVIMFKEVDLDELQDLFKSTCKFLEKYSKDDLVPREIGQVLLSMQDFAWWVGELEETPLNCLYQDLISIVNEINRSFLYFGFENGYAENRINELNKKSQ